jgi:hypothetical protein
MEARIEPNHGQIGRRFPARLELGFEWIKVREARRGHFEWSTTSIASRTDAASRI